MSVWRLLFGLPRPRVAQDGRARTSGDEAMRAWILDQREYRFFGIPQYWG